MKLIIKFGHDGPKRQVDWWRDVMDFPKLIKFEGKRWERVISSGPYGGAYDLTYSQIPMYDPHYYDEMPSFEEMFEWGSEKCQCGAVYTSFSWDHMRFCPKYKPWDKL